MSAVGIRIEPGDAAFGDPRSAEWLREHGIRADSVVAVDLYQTHFVVHRIHRVGGRAHTSERCPAELNPVGPTGRVCMLPELTVPLSVPFPSRIYANGERQV